MEICYTRKTADYSVIKQTGQKVRKRGDDGIFKKIVFLSFMSFSILAGCEDANEQNSTEKRASSEEVELNVSSSSNDKINLNDFMEIKPIALSDGGNGEYKLSDTKLENAEVILTDPLNLEKNRK